MVIPDHKPAHHCRHAHRMQDEVNPAQPRPAEGMLGNHRPELVCRPRKDGSEPAEDKGVGQGQHSRFIIPAQQHRRFDNHGRGHREQA